LKHIETNKGIYLKQHNIKKDCTKGFILLCSLYFWLPLEESRSKIYLFS